MTKIKVIEVDYNILIKGGLPAPELMMINETTQFKIINIPPEKIEYVKQLFKNPIKP